ncbi:MAG: (2Fe-2S) ferredoxin protein [Nevskia sp.]|nr:(2Fe-2S) ferredoxin protein [Nevskia sp.]
MDRLANHDIELHAPLIRAKATWQDEVVFVCRKCMRKQRDGVDGAGTSLRKWLRRALKRAGLGKRVRVIETGCFDLCPKRGVTLARGRDLADSSRPLRVLRKGENPAVLLDWLGDLRADD